ncbi:hypothetical protein [Sphingomonas bacterium]|uniref:hypothetical protein n=1 Tax=Sphingomonas bacterium TaxID=1895847 RepID=UPI001576C5EC|nr:hypothetical protein [Sphingomonas bacterium]
MRPFVIAALLVATPAVGQQAALPGAAKPQGPLGPGIVSKNAPVNGVLTLYGNERCPTDTNGAEIVVCVRRNAAEQYRVPKELRDFQVTPENASWAVKAQGGLNAGVGIDSVNSCSAVGAAGSGGCEVAGSRAWKQEQQAKKAADARVP